MAEPPRVYIIRIYFEGNSLNIYRTRSPTIGSFADDKAAPGGELEGLAPPAAKPSDFADVESSPLVEAAVPDVQLEAGGASVSSSEAVPAGMRRVSPASPDVLEVFFLQLPYLLLYIT